MAEIAIERPASRVILLDAEGNILLFCHRFDGREPIWVTPGGALELGESHEQAALRELWEETGLEDLSLGPCVWLRDHTFQWGDSIFHQRERYYVLRLMNSVEVSTEHWQEVERREMTGFRWWSLDELAVSPETFVPRALAELLPPIIAGEYPAEPIQVGV